jgi:O-Antigen ligase
MLRTVYKIYNLIFLLVLFAVFKNTPLYLLDTALGILSVVICFFWITIPYILKRHELYKFSKKAMLVFTILFILGILTTKKLYNQKISDSIIAQIDFSRIVILAFYAYAFKNNMLKISDFEWVLKPFIVINLIILILFRNYVSTEISQTGALLNFAANLLPKEFIRFGVFYFFVLFLKRGKYHYLFYVLFLLVFPNILIRFERGYFTATVMLMMVTIFSIKKTKRLIANITITCLILFLGAVILVNFTGSLGQSIITKYSNLISGLTTGSTDEASIDYRLKEVTVGWNLFKKDPILGSGRIKNTNLQAVTGMAYYPSDIGFIGILSTYGIVGITIFIIMFARSGIIFLKIIRRTQQYSYFTICVSTYMFAIAINSLQTASIILFPAYWCFLNLLYIYSRRIDDERNNEQLIEEEEQSEELDGHIISIT